MLGGAWRGNCLWQDRQPRSARHAIETARRTLFAERKMRASSSYHRGSSPDKIETGPHYAAPSRPPERLAKTCIPADRLETAAVRRGPPVDCSLDVVGVRRRLIVLPLPLPNLSITSVYALHNEYALDIRRGSDYPVKYLARSNGELRRMVAGTPGVAPS